MTGFVPDMPADEPVNENRVTARPEILAPGGSIQSIETAMAYGADAVYLGVGSLNARARAENLTEAQLPGIVEYVHSFGSRVYVTLNIPVTTVNLKETARTLAICRQAGADAVIVRDPVLMKTARETVPDLPVHASTQAGVHSVETARKMAELGCSRVILARECSRQDIRAIRNALPDLEVEVFVFGAMCFGISGMCMMGHVVSGRSGNYGSCCQSCRLPYFDENGRQAGYVFSMKDLDLSGHVAELVELGVKSFKIEGRLKTPAWVGCVTHWLKTAVTRPVPGLNPEEADRFNREISVLYSRPRTDGYFVGETDASNLLSVGNQTHMGLEVTDFKVIQDHQGTMVVFRTPVDVNIRDGLLVKVRDHIAPEGVSYIPAGIRTLLDGRGRTTVRIAADHEVRIPLDAEFDRKKIVGIAVHSADSVRARYRRVERHVPAGVSEGAAGRPTFVSVSVRPDAISADMASGRFSHRAAVNISSEPARSGGLDAEKLNKHFGPAEFEIAPGLFVNPSALKAARRELESAFENARLSDLAHSAERITEMLAGQSGSFQVSDDEIMERGNGTAAISRVTGMKPGTVFTSEGDQFVIEPGPNSTRVRKA